MSLNGICSFVLVATMDSQHFDLDVIRLLPCELGRYNIHTLAYLGCRYA